MDQEHQTHKLVFVMLPMNWFLSMAIYVITDAKVRPKK